MHVYVLLLICAYVKCSNSDEMLKKQNEKKNSFNFLSKIIMINCLTVIMQPH